MSGFSVQAICVPADKVVRQRNAGGEDASSESIRSVVCSLDLIEAQPHTP